MRTRVRLGVLFVLVLAGLAQAAPPAAEALPAKFMVQVTVGYRHACARSGDGTAVCWGQNSSGQLGAGSTASTSDVPVEVKKPGTPLAGRSITDIDTGYLHTCAVANGAAYCWGQATSGQLGNGIFGSGATAVSRTAVAVVTAGTPLAGKTVKQVATGQNHSCALATDGTVGCWGTNIWGSLGNDTVGNRTNKPVAPLVTGTALQGRTVSSITAGGDMTCVTTTDGQAACWGGTQSFGDGTGTTSSFKARLVKKTGTALAGKTVASVKVTSERNVDHACAVATDGTMACWGYASPDYPLGDGGTTPSDVPVAVKTVGTALAGKQVARGAVGGYGSCAATTDGSVACWGAGSVGWLARGVAELPTTIAVAAKTAGTALAGAKVKDVDAGDSSVCALGYDGRVVCWGSDLAGQLGDGDATHAGFGNANVAYQAVGVLGTGVYAPFATAEALVTQQYQDFLGRPPTSGELLLWLAALDDAASPGDVVASLRGSSDNTTHVDPVARLYWAYFDRIPDYGGLVYWIGIKRGGGDLGSISDAFALSPEFKGVYGTLSNNAFVSLVYANVLDRTPDAGGYSYWTGLLNNGTINRGQMMIGFSESPEYRSENASEVNVAVLYVQMLRRSPTTGELAAGVAQLDGGTPLSALAQQILVSGEYGDRFL